MKIYLERKNFAYTDLCLVMSAALLFTLLAFPFSAQAGPVMQIDAEKYSAGEVYAGEVVEHRFGISNVGDEPLEVQRVRSSWGCTAALVSAETLQPGEDTELLVRFKTARMRGEVKRRIVVYSNDMDHNAVSLSVTAHIKPELQVEPARLEIVPPPEGGERRVELELANLSNRDLKQLSARTTVKGLEAEGEVQRTLAPGEKTVLSYSIKFPSHEDAARNVRSGYIIVEARGYGRSRERIPVLIQNSFQQD